MKKAAKKDKNVCQNCGGKLNMHYYLWCPICDKPEPEEKPVYEFFKVARYIAAHEGYDDNWVRNVLGNMDYPDNDCYIDWYIGDPDEYEYGQNTDCMVQFDQGLMKYFDLEQEDSVILNISW